MFIFNNLLSKVLSIDITVKIVAERTFLLDSLNIPRLIIKCTESIHFAIFLMSAAREEDNIEHLYISVKSVYRVRMVTYFIALIIGKLKNNGTRRLKTIL